MKEKEVEDITFFLKVISEKNRFSILIFLREGERCVCEIYKHLNLSQNLTSHHLKIMKNMSIVDSRRDGTKVIYFLEKNEIKKYISLLLKIIN